MLIGKAGVGTQDIERRRGVLVFASAATYGSKKERAASLGPLMDRARERLDGDGLNPRRRRNRRRRGSTTSHAMNTQLAHQVTPPAGPR